MLNQERARIRYKEIKVLDIIAVLLYIAVFKFYAGPQIVQQIVKIAFIAIVFLYLFSCTSWRQMNNPATFMALSFMLSSIIGLIHGDVKDKSFLDGTLYAVCIFCMHGVIQQYAIKGRINNFIDIVYVLTAIYCLISIVSIYYVGVSSYGTEKEYFFGNKFSTSYFFILLTGLYHVRNYQNRKNRRKRTGFFFLALLSFGVSYWVRCSTATLGTVVLIVASVVPDYIKKKIQSKWTITILIIVLGLFPFFVTSILRIPQLQYFFYQVMGKSIGLTGRVHIYNQLPSIISNRLIFGYGYNSFIVASVAGYGNAQNGLMEVIVNYGIVGAALFVINTYHHLSIESEINKHGLFAVIYAFVLCSTVEVSYNYFFYVALYTLYFSSFQQNEN